MPEILGSFMGSPMSWNGKGEILPLLQYAVQIAVVVGPEADARVGLRPLGVPEQRTRERGLRGGNQQPVRAVDPRRVVVLVVDLAQLERKRTGGLLHDRHQVEVAVGD